MFESSYWTWERGINIKRFKGWGLGKRSWVSSFNSISSFYMMKYIYIIRSYTLILIFFTFEICLYIALPIVTQSFSISIICRLRLLWHYCRTHKRRSESHRWHHSLCFRLYRLESVRSSVFVSVYIMCSLWYKIFPVHCRHFHLTYFYFCFSCCVSCISLTWLLSSWFLSSSLPKSLWT